MPGPFDLESSDAIADIFDACDREKDAWKKVTDPNGGTGEIYEGKADFSLVKNVLQKIAKDENLGTLGAAYLVRNTAGKPGPALFVKDKKVFYEPNERVEMKSPTFVQALQTTTS